MKNVICIPILLIGFFLASGCSFHRGNVASLARAQNAYYTDLIDVLKTNRATLEWGLTEQLKANLNRRREVLRWDRDLVKADVVLQAPEANTNDIKLLLMKTTESDLSSLHSFLALGSIDTNRVQAVLRLYDALIKAAAALATNNQAIAQYLGGSDTTYVLHSLDLSAMVSAVTDIRDAQGELKGLNELSAEEKKNENDRLEKNLEQARTTLVRALNALPKK